MRQYLDFQQLEPGDSLPPITKEPITKVQLVRYAGASGDFNPIHTDDAAAQQAGLPGVIAHGLLVMGFVGQALTTWAPKRYLKRFKVRFMDMAIPGDVLTVEAAVAGKTSVKGGLRLLCDTTAKDQLGRIKLSGQFEAVVPD